MEIISKISKGSRMDQIYIPKNRVGFNVGSHVIIKPLETRKTLEKPYFYKIASIEPIKIKLIEEIFNILDNIMPYENVIITGSFLQSGFNFEDIDVLVICGRVIDNKEIEKAIEKTIKIKFHVTFFNKETFLEALRTDPLWRIMLGKCVSKYRLAPIPKKIINYKILDLHLLKSKPFIDNFDYLSGKEKYKLIRNLIAIKLFLTKEKITENLVDGEIKKLFDVSIEKIKENILDKNQLIKKYKTIYNKTFNMIMNCIKDGSKQK